MTFRIRSTRSAALAACALLLPALAACSNCDHDSHSTPATTTSAAVPGRTTLAMPITVPGTATLIVPFAIDAENDSFQTRDANESDQHASDSSSTARPMPESEFSSSRPRYRSGSVRWHNAIIRDLHSGEQWPILNRRGVISSWAICGHPPHESSDQFHAKALVFLATIDDTNHDGVLNDLDARVAIVTGPDGRDPRIVTPASAQVWSVGYDAENNKLYFLVVADTTGDGKFDRSDTPIPYVCDLTPGAIATPLISQDSLTHVQTLLK